MSRYAPVRITALALVSGCVLAAAPAARAALVAPGETVQLRSGEFLRPEGEVLAEDAVPFFVVMEAGDAPPAAVPGTLTSTVLREPTGELTFTYAIDFAGPGDDGAGGAKRTSMLSVTGFGPARTDVLARLAFEEAFVGSRSADGSTVTVESDTPGEGGSPTLLVRTDATDFDAGGVLHFAAADPLAGPPPVIASGQTDMPGVFRPAARPSAVPLPPGVVTGAATLIASAILRASRRTGRRF